MEYAVFHATITTAEDQVHLEVERQRVILCLEAAVERRALDLEKLLERTRRDCLIADIFFTWATEAAEKFFHGTGYFSLCSENCIRVTDKTK
ncbi:hypothetical protein ARALYDRAFT_891164 [Arabidopsis lyrata subsp. lyrata]|uniref:Uncharacterized protein n=1 Tax=Arabidopsis lyrata subsp. lyrata TaxID=81972 RepID=D7KL57_ARALL|nr:hypothetical protein ARALYDRAFT_891164 [Arabidopsis lyrata subsp. lyrata]